MILQPLKISYSSKIMLNRAQLLMQAILILGTAVILSFCYFFVFGVDASINRHDNGAERTLTLNKVILAEKTFNALIEDVEAIPEVESAVFDIVDEQQMLIIKLKDYRMRSETIAQLPEYIISAGIIVHQIESVTDLVAKSKLAGILAMAFLTIVYMLFYFGMLGKIIKCYERANHLLLILGYSLKSRIEMSLIPFLESALLAFLAYFTLTKFVFSPLINKMLNQISRLTNIGVEFKFSFWVHVLILFIATFVSVFILSASYTKET
ncbi:hypothetical protein [Fusibacter bizertensis]